MSRATLAHLAAVCGLCAGFAVGLTFASAGWATLAFAATIVLAVLITGLAVLIARRLDHRVASRLSAIGKAVGHAGMRRGHEVEYVEAIVATLHQRLQRASAVKNGVAASPLVLAIVGENGEIAVASAGLSALGPDFARGAPFPDFAQLAEKGEVGIEAGGKRYRAVLATADGERRIVSLVQEGLVVPDGLIADIGAALVSGATDRDLVERLRALGQEALPLLRAFEAMGEGLALVDNVLDGRTEALRAAQGRNDALGMRARALADLINAFAAARAEEEEIRARLEQKLKRIGEMVDRHRVMAVRLREAALDAREDGTVLKAALNAGGERAGKAGGLGREARATVGEAIEVARANNEAATNLGALTSEIANLVAAIEDVSFRTNLIALNAAIEAARAGEKGAGFAAVAEEVRILAQRASGTAKEIKALVTRGRSRSEDSAEGAAALERLVCDLDAHLQNLSNENDKIADALSQGKGALAQLDRKVAAIADDAERATGGVHPHKLRSA